MNPAARVIPDVASFAVDDGFWYSIPEHLVDDVAVGSIVRVPLSGRRVRGWVVETAPGREGTLKEIAGVSGVRPVFDARLLQSLSWSARHYVAPLSTLLGRATPPNLPRSIPGSVAIEGAPGAGSPIANLVRRTASGSRAPVTAVVGNWHDLEWVGDLTLVAESGRSVLVVAASVAEVETISAAAHGLHRSLLVPVTGDDDASDTRAWQAAQSPPRIVVGTPKTAAWQIADLGLAVVLEENRRAMKDRQTPTLHVRELMTTRSRIEGFNLVFYGPTPGVELLAGGADVITPGNRAWPLVEIVDRTDEPPGSGYLSGRVVAALKSVVSSGNRAFVFTHRRVGYASTRCTSCRALHVCARCGSRLGRVDRCPRCEAMAGPCSRCGGTQFEEMGTVPERLVGEVNRRVRKGVASTYPGDTTVTVGTERDLASLERVDLAVAADVDGMLSGVGYRTTEEALRQLARLATMVAPTRGARLMMQTTRPDSLLVKTMRRGDPIPYLERVLVERAKDGSPPSSEMIAVELRGSVPDDAGETLSSLDPAAVVLGPMAIEDGQRWLITGRLGKARLQLRPIVGRWRDRGATVRVDVDPIDI